ncbi:FAD:protein FMN transferase [Ferviditalea candida]|uniref:FAD:protein FMN transferase n=1 Tax=Ferviditalea candida TaxID=3108399 RepID=A0ABU5ZC28_9BACL|nr:FAD:protein FMN transferase [Paenibacillaceae bacterium T2]
MVMTTQDHQAKAQSYSFRFRAMNTEIEAFVFCTEEQVAPTQRLVFDWFQAAERRFSRFLPASELSYLNRLTGQTCLVSEAMLEVLLLAESYTRLTEGIFQPLILKALEQSGYNQSFELMEHGPNYRIQLTADRTQANDDLRIVTNSSMKSVLLPTDAKMDLGGIVKSWAVKRLAGWLQKQHGLQSGMINAGGDLAVWGRPDGGSGAWRIGIENPWKADQVIGILALDHGAVATSSKLGRQWDTEHGKMHHLIDPRSMRPSESDVLQCTVTGEDVLECEIWSKVICILGYEEGAALFTKKTSGYEALVFTEKGEVHKIGELENFQGGDNIG